MWAWRLTRAAFQGYDGHVFLAFVQGIAAQVPTADLVSDGFGMIAIVAMMPIIAIELLGALYQFQSRKAAKAAVAKKQEVNHG